MLPFLFVPQRAQSKQKTILNCFIAWLICEREKGTMASQRQQRTEQPARECQLRAEEREGGMSEQQFIVRLCTPS
jgi:hypothetical protein